jgi:membrane peptidoglycan carboxypeptidase
VSSNIAFAKVGQGCGTRLYDVARRLGFGSPTGISLAGEASGVLRHPDQWSARSSATLAIGYEVMTTPLQLALGYAAVANDGVLMRPRLVRSITDPEGRTVYRSEPEEVRRALSSEVAATLRSFMREVVTSGTGKGAALSWAEVGGKTGTTEKYIKGVGYDSRRHFASFVGIAPLDDPQIVCFVMIDEPQGLSAFGGSAAAPVFREVMDVWGRFPGASISPPYRTLVVQEVDGPGGGIGPHSLEARNWRTRPSERPSPPSGVPDVRGVSLRRALQTLQAHGLGARVEGTGVVTRQIPPPGAPLTRAVALVCSRRSQGAVILASGNGSRSPGGRGGGVRATRED